MGNIVHTPPGASLPLDNTVTDAKTLISNKGTFTIGKIVTVYKAPITEEQNTVKAESQPEPTHLYDVLLLETHGMLEKVPAVGGRNKCTYREEDIVLIAFVRLDLKPVILGDLPLSVGYIGERRRHSIPAMDTGETLLRTDQGSFLHVRSDGGVLVQGNHITPVEDQGETHPPEQFTHEHESYVMVGGKQGKTADGVEVVASIGVQHFGHIMQVDAQGGLQLSSNFTKLVSEYLGIYGSVVGVRAGRRDRTVLESDDDTRSGKFLVDAGEQIRLEVATVDREVGSADKDTFVVRVGDTRAKDTRNAATALVEVAKCLRLLTGNEASITLKQRAGGSMESLELAVKDPEDSNKASSIMLTKYAIRMKAARISIEGNVGVGPTDSTGGGQILIANGMAGSTVVSLDDIILSSTSAGA